MEYKNILEISTFEKIKNQLNGFSNEFRQKNITYSIEFKHELTESNYYSEVEINFYKNGNFIDVIEFFLMRDNKLFFDEKKGYEELKHDYENILKSN